MNGSIPARFFPPDAFQAMAPDEIHLKLLKILQINPDMTQRELSRELGVSLGKANYCLKALLDKGWIKVNNFRKSPRKLSYVYLLTPAGIEAKATLTSRFLKRKMREYELLKQEIEELTRETQAQEKDPQ